MWYLSRDVVVRIMDKLNELARRFECPTENAEEEKNTTIHGAKLKADVKDEINCLYFGTEFYNSSSSNFFPAERRKENIIFLNERFLSSESLFHAFEFEKDQLTAQFEALVESNDGRRFRNVRNRIAGTVRSAESVKKGAKRKCKKLSSYKKLLERKNSGTKCKKSSSHEKSLERKKSSTKCKKSSSHKKLLERKNSGTKCTKSSSHEKLLERKNSGTKCKKSSSHRKILEKRNSGAKLPTYLNDLQSVVDSSELLQRKFAKSVTFKDSSGDVDKNVSHVVTRRGKISASRYRVSRRDDDNISSSSYQSSSYESPIRLIATPRRRRAKRGKFSPSKTTIRSPKYRRYRRHELQESLSQIEFLGIPWISESRRSRRNFSFTLTNATLEDDENVESKGEKSTEGDDDEEPEFPEIYSTTDDASLFEKKSLASIDMRLSKICIGTDCSTSFCAYREDTSDGARYILVAEGATIDTSDVTFNRSKPDKGSIISFTRVSYADFSNFSSTATSCENCETLIIRVEDESTSNDFERPAISRDDFLNGSSSKPAIYEPIVNILKHRRSRSFYADKGSKHCVICGRQEARKRSYVLPTCIVKGATPLLKADNNPWTRVAGNTHCPSCRSNLSRVLATTQSGMPGFPGTLKAIKRSVRVKREAPCVCADLNARRSLAEIACRIRASNVEINVTDTNECTSVTIIQLANEIV